MLCGKAPLVFKGMVALRLPMCRRLVFNLRQRCGGLAGEASPFVLNSGELKDRGRDLARCVQNNAVWVAEAMGGAIAPDSYCPAVAIRSDAVFLAAVQEKLAIGRLLEVGRGAETVYR